MRGASRPPVRPDDPTDPGSGRTRRLRRGLVLGFLTAVAVLLVTTVRDIDWAQVGRTLLTYPPRTLAVAAGLSAAGHLVYTSFDLLGGRYTRHALPPLRVMGIAFVSYVFALNLSAIVGAAGTRARLYSRFGLRGGTIARIIGFSVVTNWLGYLVLGGLVLTWGGIETPAAWGIGPTAIRWLGGGMLLVVAIYLVACAGAQRRVVRLRHVELTLPPVRMALAQMVAASASWLAIGATLYVLMRGQVPFSTVIGVELFAAVAALILHVPAGLGVLEAVYLASLEHRLPAAEILGALVAFRGVYYLLPLGFAVLVYLAFERRAQAEPSTAGQTDSDDRPRTSRAWPWAGGLDGASPARRRRAAGPDD